MSISSFLVASVLACALFLPLKALDPCKGYSEINEPRRSQNFVPSGSDVLLCDRGLRDGWYRFTSKSGGMMPSKCIDLFHCGTHAPIWMNGAHPAVADGVVTRKACVSLPSIKPGDKCCAMSHDIKVKNCGSFFVYYLTRTKACAMAYCAGTATPCPSGTYSASGFPPCTKDAYPKLTQPPQLTGPHIGKDKQSMNFNCEVQYTTAKEANFEVVWLFDHKPSQTVPASTLTGKERVAILDQKYLTGNMGKLLGCKVSGFYKKQLMSPAWESNGFWVGVEVSPNMLEVSENDRTVNVTLSSTIPILCNHRFTCGVDFELDIDHQSIDELVAAESCTKTISTKDWDPVKKRAEITFEVMAVRDFLRDRSKRLALKFRPLFSFSPNIWHNYALTPTTVITKDIGTQTCTSSGDPHLRGFDRKSSYHLYRPGEYVYYLSKKRPFEVHVRTWICANRVACNCGVAAREGNDVVEVDLCHGRVGRSYPKVKVKSNGGVLEGTQIKRSANGRSFKIRFPSGAWVKADTDERHMNLQLQAPSDDFTATAGVCGTFDGNSKNDFTKKDGTVHRYTDDYPNAFFESWRIPYGESLFDKVPKASSLYEFNPPFCKCHHKTGTVDCRVGNNIKDPADRQTSTWKDLTKKLDTKNRLRRSTTYHDLDTDADEFYVFNYGLDFKESKRPEFPTPSGLTKKTATEYCQKKILKSQLATECSKQKEVDFKTFVEDCVEDIKISDDLTFAKDAVADMEKACQQVILQNPSNYGKDGNGSLVPPPFVGEHMCLDNCNFRGNCVKGVCKCNTGFAGEDCAVVTSKPPTVLEVIRPVCDIRKRPCQTTFMIVRNVKDSFKLACRVREVEIVNGKLSKVPGPYKTTVAEFESFAEVACQLPPHSVGKGKPARAFLISITNDGKLFSDETLFMVHDSNCQSCSNETCFHVPNTCLIEGRCYLPHQTAVGSPDKMCSPDKSTTSWTAKVAGMNPWTATSTGCMCNFSPQRADCACCVSGGCQCDEKHKDKCVECGKLDQC